MKYVVAIAACFVEAVVYACIGVLLGWKVSGGLIPMMILFAIWAATWTAITKRRGSGQESEESQSEEGAPPTDSGERQ